MGGEQDERDGVREGAQDDVRRQPALLDDLAPPTEPDLPAGTADEDPIAQVLLESAVPHLDRAFDYTVPTELDAAVRPGCRVRVRFSGREVPGYVLSRSGSAVTRARLSPLRKVVSPISVVSPEILALAEQVAARGAGVTSDVLRAAVPTRVARVERAFEGVVAPAPDLRPEDPLSRQAALALKSYGPDGWARLVADRVSGCLDEGGDAVVVLPDARDVDVAEAALTERLGAEAVARLSADMGPTPRYRSFLRLRHGQAGVAVGTRSAVFAPVPRPRLIIVLDDEDRSHEEPRAPYHHVRETALLRTVSSGAALMLLSTSRSLEVQRLVERGWLEDLAPDRPARRAAAPRVTAAADSHQQAHDGAAVHARLPSAAYRAARQGLERGPVLVQVGRAGFVPALLCDRCRSRQQCPECSGPLALPPHHGQSRTVRCRWCGLHRRDHRCTTCGHTAFRAAGRGADRTAQELGRAFPSVPVVSSTGDHPVVDVSERPALVVSTPGVEPTAPQGYAAALLLDGDSQLMREGLDVPRRVLARWFRAASLVRSQQDRGEVVVAASDEELTGALVRWDPVGYARRELCRRLELGLPPARRMLSLTGDPGDAEAFVAAADLPEHLAWIGPTPTDGGAHRYLLFFGYADGDAVSEEMLRVRRTSSAQRGVRGVRLRVDDADALQV
ncbi:MAG: primosomal protein N' [Nesterenkonia sp.]|nr:primosomal protein N' [Nesterenkonia sp.]